MKPTHIGLPVLVHVVEDHVTHIGRSCQFGIDAVGVLDIRVVWHLHVYPCVSKFRFDDEGIVIDQDPGRRSLISF